MKCHAILNRAARALRNANAEIIRADINRLLHQAGMTGPVELVEPEALHPAVLAAIAAEPDVILVGGGDGTASAAASAIVQSDIALGIIPLGTLNHFAEDLGISTDYREAISQMLSGEVRRIDVGEVNGLTFVNNSILGLYPEMVAIRDRAQSVCALAKWPAMVLAALRVMTRFHRIAVDVSLGGTVHKLHVPILGVSNNLYDERSGMSLHRSQLDGGTLGIYLAHARSPVRLARAVIAALHSKDGMAANVTVLKSAECVVSAKDRHLLVANDGEVRRLSSPLRYRLRRGAIRVLVPANGAGQSRVHHPSGGASNPT